jgi:branched-chain amino acid transport system ATP-binding protein
VFSIADRVTVLVGGRVLETGAPAQIRASASVRVAYLGEEQR